jgi:hypothetical protein
VERRVVGKLALAHETDQLTKGCEVLISVVETDKEEDASLKISIKKPDQTSFVDLEETMPAAQSSNFL